MTLLALSLAWLAGLGLAAAGLPQADLAALPLGGGAATGFAASRRPELAALALACTALFVLGALRLDRSLPPPDPGGIAALNGAVPVTLRGVVAEEPEERPNSQRFVFSAEERFIDDAWQPTSGKVLVTTRPFPRYAYGDRVELEARLDAPPVFDAFDYRKYLSRRGITALTAFPQVRRLSSGEGSAAKAAVIDVRDRLGDSLSQALPEPEAALARGMLLGQRSSIPAALEDDFNRAGISHLIAISGSNVSLVAGLALAPFTLLLGRRRAVLAAMLFVAAFVALVGAAPSVLRAGVMGTMMLGAVLAGRPGSALTAVAFAAALLTVWQPLAILDVAFQLSFAATLGLVLLAPSMTRLTRTALERGTPSGIAAAAAETIGMTAAASLAVFPITAANFERVSIVAIPANLLAVPLFGVVIVTSFLASLAGLFSSGLARFLGLFADVPLKAMIETARLFSSLPHASLEVRGAGIAAALVSYSLIGLLTLAINRRRQALPATPARPRLGPIIPATGLVLAVAAFVWVDVVAPNGGALRVTVLDVGQGDAILIATPSGNRILVDGGPSGSALLNALGRELPGGSRRIDLVVLTHPQDDHVAGLVAAGERYDVRLAAVSGSSSETGSYQAWQARIRADETPVRELRTGEFADLGSGVRLEVLAPLSPHLSGTIDDLNANSIVLRLTYGAVSFLLTGDLSSAGERALLDARGDLKATMLKVGHHGSDGSSSEDFLAAVRPAVAVVSAGQDNAYGHPSPSTLVRLAGVPVYRTDRNGNIRFETDGKRLFVRPDRDTYQLVPVSAR